ncbi:MAG: hypothetical protein ACREYC_24625, partial [Gammaproteobacteria bacterium]
MIAATEGEGGKMSVPRRRRLLLIGLLVAGLAPVIPDPGLADEGKSPPYVRMDAAEDTGAGEASLINEVLKLEEVLAYAQV